MFVTMKNRKNLIMNHEKVYERKKRIVMSDNEEKECMIWNRNRSEELVL